MSEQAFLLESTARCLCNVYDSRIGQCGTRYLKPEHFGQIGEAYVDFGLLPDWSVWKNLAKKVLKQGFDPKTFIEAQFDACSEGDGKTILPQRLLKEFKVAAGRYWQKAPRTGVVGHTLGFQVMHHQLDALADRLIPLQYQTRNDLLLDPVLPFTPCFRVLLADSSLSGFEQISEIYGGRAQTEYQADKGLREYLGRKKDVYPVLRCGGPV